MLGGLCLSKREAANGRGLMLGGLCLSKREAANSRGLTISCNSLGLLN